MHNFNQFFDSLSARLHCTDDYRDGVHMRPRATAATKKYIQPNPTNSLNYLCFDIDYPFWLTTVEDLGLPTPSIITQNPQNNHCHVFYRLETPVHFNFKKSSKQAMDYAKAVEAGLAKKLKADLGFAGYLVKNPAHDAWYTCSFDIAYSLADLHDYLDLKKAANDDEAYGFGRNVELFENLRHYAYRKFRERGYEAVGFFEVLLERANMVNGTFRVELHQSELEATCRSIAKWCIANITAESFGEVQAARGKKSGAARRANREFLMRQCKSLSNQNLSQREIAERLKVPKSTVGRWLK